MRFKVVTVLCVLACAAGPVRADEKAAQDEMTKKWEEMTSPGAEHAELAKMVGKWNAEVKSWMDPSAPPMVMGGSCDMTSVLGGRYIMQSFHGEMMGQAFEGFGYTGFDKVQKKYVSTWMDNMSTGVMMCTGDPSKDGKTSAMSGMTSDPMAGAVVPFDEVMTWVDADHMKFEMFMPGHDGKRMKSLEIMYTRQK